MTAFTESPVDWYPWPLQTYWPKTCGGHWYVNHPVSLTDIKRNAEKGYHSGGKFQVVHLHPEGDPCESLPCVAYGRREEIPQLAEGTT